MTEASQTYFRAYTAQQPQCGLKWTRTAMADMEQAVG